jgi:Polysaccharide lyase
LDRPFVVKRLGVSLAVTVCCVAIVLVWPSPSYAEHLSTACTATLPVLRVTDVCPLVKEDTAGAEDPVPLWGRLDCQAYSRHQHQRIAIDGDLHTTGSGTVQTNLSYRRLTVIDTDDVYGERCELGRNEHRAGYTPQTFALYREGQHRVTFMSLRLPNNFPLGTNLWQVVAQMKQTQPSANGGGTPMLSLEAHSGRWRLMQSTSSGASSSTRQLWSTPAQAGAWTRFVFDVRYSQDPSVGFVKVYADLNGDGDALDSGEQSPGIRTYTLKRETTGGSSTDGIAPGESIPSHLRAGIYHASSIPCPAPLGCSIEIDNVQVFDVP